MKELEGTALQEYIQNAISVETDIATQEKLKEDVINCVAAKKPILQLIPEPKAPATPNTEFRSAEFISGGAYAWLFFAILMAVISLIVLSICGIQKEIVVVLLISIVCMIPYLSTYFIKKKRFMKEVAQAWDIYGREKADYNMLKEKTIKANEQRTNQQRTNLQEWNQFNQQMKQTMGQAMEETKKTLDKLYALDVIYPKYRNLPALTSIYEYLITGRCEGLTGPHGAYNLYEDEVRKDMVISQLSVVIQNLEQIKQNQYMLYQQVKEIQQTTNSIENELRQIKGYSVQIASLTALNAYYSALNERNTRITMWCNI